MIIAGHVVPSSSDAADLAIEAANQVLGGDFSARLNMNLREDKNWSYGAYSTVVDAQAQRPFLILAPVQTDKTADSIAELRRELSDYVGERPADAEELERVIAKNTLSLPGRWETIGSVNSSLAAMVRFDLPDDYWTTYADRTRGLTLDAVQSQAQRVLKPDNMIWVVVGDLERIREQLEALEIGELRLIDTDGNPVN